MAATSSDNAHPRTEGQPPNPLTFGLISGPGYHNRKGGLERLQKVLSQYPDLPHRIVHTPQDVDEAVNEYLTMNLDVIGINGGDGTLGMVVTNLIRRDLGPRLPRLVALAGGRTNMSHGDLGLRGEPHRALKRLIPWLACPDGSATTVERTALAVQRCPEDDPLYGFFVGAAAIYRASQKIWDKRSQTRLPGMKTVLGTAVHVSSLLTRLLVGKNPFPPTSIEVRVDDEPMDETRYTVLFVTTLDRMALGFKPFWSSSRAPLRLTTIAHAHRHFLRAALAGIRGRPNKYLTREHGFESHTGWSITLGIEEPVTLDGEVVTPLENQPLLITSGPRLTFIQV